jgi:transcriptional regulator with XRE-family HTH domain
MPISPKELGQRLRAAREASRMTQEDVAHYLRLPTSTMAQRELGNRALTSFELDRLAYLFGRDMRDFFAQEFHAKGVLLALLQGSLRCSGTTSGRA